MEKRNDLHRIEVSSIFEGICFSDAVYFEDGKNMFLPANKRAKKSHLQVIKKWNVPYLLTNGHEIDEPVEEIQFAELESIDDVEELEEIDEVEEISNAEELKEL